MLTYTAPTRRSAMTKPRRVRIFIMRDGICWSCKQRIRDGEAWNIEHPDSVVLGGSDRDEDLWPIHRTKRCLGSKNAADAGLKAKRDRIIDAGYAGPEKRSGFASSRFRKRMDGTVVDKITGQPARRA